MSGSEPEKLLNQVPQEQETITGVEHLSVEAFLLYLNDLDAEQKLNDEDSHKAIDLTVAEIQDLDNRRAALHERRIILQRNRKETAAAYNKHRSVSTLDNLLNYIPATSDRHTDDAYQIYAAWKSSDDDESARKAFVRLQNLRDLLEGADPDNPKYLVMYSDVEDDTTNRKRYSIFAAISKPLIGVEVRITSTLNPILKPVINSLAYGYIEISTDTYRDVLMHDVYDENLCSVLSGLNRDYPSEVEINLVDESVYGILTKDELEESGLLSVSASQTMAFTVNLTDKDLKNIIDIWQLRLKFGLPINFNELNDVKQAYIGRYLPSHIFERMLEVEGIINPNRANSIQGQG